MPLWRAPRGEHITALASPTGAALLASGGGGGGGGGEHLLALATNRSVLLLDVRRQHSVLCSWDLALDLGARLQLPTPLVTSLLWLPLSPAALSADTRARALEATGTEACAHAAALLAGQASTGRASSLLCGWTDQPADLFWQPEVGADAGAIEARGGSGEGAMDEEREEEGEEEEEEQQQRRRQQQWSREACVPALVHAPGALQRQRRELLRSLRSGRGVPQTADAAAGLLHRPLCLRRFVPEQQPMPAALVPPLHMDRALQQAIRWARRGRVHGGRLEGR